MLSPCDDPITVYPFQHVVLTGVLLCKTNPKGQDLGGIKPLHDYIGFFKTFCNGNPVNKISKFDIFALYNYKIYDHFLIL